MSPAARGAALVGLLVIVGIIGLQVLDDSSPGGRDVTVSTLAGETTTTVAATQATEPQAAETTVPTTTTLKTKKNADVKVFVYNASGVTGMASNMSDKLKSVGYNTVGTDDITPERTGTTVSCRTGLDAEATKLAKNVGASATVTPFPSNPPKGADAAGADCIVILGK
ncbi:MAG: LytR C-terminal domain-containing protein [Acidimicrobiia bacterium]